MASARDPDGAAARRRGIVDRVVGVTRGRREADPSTPEGSTEPADVRDRRIRELEQRVDHLEALVEGLQDSVHRESRRQGGRLKKLEEKLRPRDARGDA